MLHGGEILIVGCIYRSPNSTKENNDKLWQLIKEVSDMQCSQIMNMGDFNFSNINCETISTHESENSDTYLLLKGIRDTYLYQHTFEPTRGRMSNEPYTLDLILTPDEHDITGIKNLSPLGKSDHSV